MKLSEIIGLSLVELKYLYSEKEGLSSFNSLLRLSNGKIILIPVFPDAEVWQKSKMKFFFARSMKINKKLIENQIIKDFYFKYLDDELCEWESCFIELSNNYFITEVSLTPVGSMADLKILSKEEFLKLKEEDEQEDGVVIKSYLTELQK